MRFIQNLRLVKLPFKSLIIFFIFFALSLCFIPKSFAQNPELNDVNLQLRNLFSSLSKPSPSKKFLYDMSAHSTDSVWYVSNCADTNQTDLWYKVYEEMYYAAYDTAMFPRIDTIINKVNNIGADTIPIGIMNFSFYDFKDNALSTNTYFNFDTVNTILTDKYPRPDFPYTDNNVIFMSAPLVNEAAFANPTFIIDPQYFYYDVFNADKFTKTSIIQIDFGDGTGWHNYDPTVVSYYQPNYSTTSNVNPVIQVRQVNSGTSGVYGNAQSRFFPGTTINDVLPNEILVLPGLLAGIFNGCNTTAATGKTVIYLEGIDILDFLPNKNRNVPRIYNEMLRNDKIIELKNQGYKFVVVDWRNSRIDMRFNALYLVNLLQVLKQRSTDDEQFIVMGESMGGVIARYALTYMEGRDYQTQNTAPFFTEQNDPQSLIYLAANSGIFNLPTNWVEKDKMHNTRLFISVDAPHRGANVPLSIQKAYKNILGIFGQYIGSLLSSTTYAFNLFLDGKAAKQLLIEHVSTESGSGFYKTYGNSPVRTSFMNQLAVMGDYPQFAKVVLISNGALSGASQINYYTGAPRTPNDRLINFNLDTYVKILFIKLPLFGGKLDARTNPDGSEKILAANAGAFRIKIKLKWFGVKIYADYNSIINVQDYANTRPYCTSAGSRLGNRLGLVSSAVGVNSSFNLSNNYWLFNLFSYSNTNDGQGCVRFKSHLGLNGFASANFDYALCTDGPYFGFVPVQSALDYGPRGSLGLATNIERLDINTKLANIPERADVIIGNPGVSGDANKEHLGFRNDGILNVSNNIPPFGNFSNTYFSCVNQTPDVRRGLLNLEIGDEELYLENNTLPFMSQYKVEYDIHLNERNRYYQYPSTVIGTPAADQILPGIYSKQSNYSITPTGFATFIYDVTLGLPLNHLGFYGNATGNFAQINEPLINCCINFIGARGTQMVSIKAISKPVTENYLRLSPNPNTGKLLTLKYQFKTIGNVKLSMADAMGKQIYNTMLFIPISNQQINSVIDLQKLKLSAGLYFIRLANSKEILNSKLIVID